MPLEYPQTTAMYLGGGLQGTTITEILSLCKGIKHLFISEESNHFVHDIAPLQHVLNALPLKVLSLHIGVTLTKASIVNFNVFARLTHLEIDDTDMLRHVEMGSFPQLTHLALWPFFYNPGVNVPGLVRRLLRHPPLQVLLFRVPGHNQCAKFLEYHALNDPRIVIAPSEMYVWDDFGRGSMLLWELAEKKANMPQPNHSQSFQATVKL
jgi:hypothetical protein